MEYNKFLTNKNNEENKVIIDNAEIVAYGLVAPIIFSIGLIGNLATLATLANTAKFSGRIYSYIRALALSDFACLVFSVFISALSKYDDSWMIKFTFSNNHYKDLNITKKCMLIFSSEYPVNFDNGFMSGEILEGTTMYAAAFYWAYFENVIINGFFASSVFIIVCMTIDR